MKEIKQIFDPLFIKKVKRISELLKTIAEMEIELKSLNINVEVNTN
jgi:hypothetical protein